MKKKDLNILVACEESQRVCIEFRKLGYNAFSCDIEPESGGHPEWHIMQDVLPLLNGYCAFETCDGLEHSIDSRWDLIIAHPPCTYLSTVCNRSFSPKCNPAEKVEKRERERIKAYEFFMKFVDADCDHIAIENPTGYMNSHYRKPDQIIHPYFFGDPYKKRTCLWLKNLPALQYTNVLPEPEPLYIRSGKKINWCEGIRNTHNGQSGRAKERSKTFPGIARAIAQQWSQFIEEKL